MAISAVSVVEIAHGIYRTKTREDGERRNAFVNAVVRSLVVHPFNLDVGLLAGRIEGEQAAKGIVIPFEDLQIGCTALHLGYAIATHNTKHFHLIPGLTVVSF